jgi:hypothetical protein
VNRFTVTHDEDTNMPVVVDLKHGGTVVFEARIDIDEYDLAVVVATLLNDTVAGIKASL